MKNKHHPIRTLLLDSRYRNRTAWPNPAEFSIPISSSSSMDSADDPISYGLPLISWTANKLDTSTVGTDGSITVTVSGDLASMSDESNLVVAKAKATGGLQYRKGYYNGLILQSDIPRRIRDYSWLSSSLTTEYGQIGLGSFPLNDTLYTSMLGADATITDPTSVSDTLYPVFFVPNGSNNDTSYVGHILYNESINESRMIREYDPVNHLVRVDTLGSRVGTHFSGPVTGWTASDNYSIRLEPPLIPSNGTLNPVAAAVTNATNSRIYIALSSLSVNTVFRNKNAYQGAALRVLPNNSRLTIPPTAQYYIYSSSDYVAPFNETRVITSSEIDNTNTYLILNVYPPFSVTPTGLNLEVNAFSHNNAVPLSIVSSNGCQHMYEISLVSLSLPSIVSSSYLLVTLSTAGMSAGAGSIISNNRNAGRATFVARKNHSGIYVGEGSTVILSLRPGSDSLYFCVRSDTGTAYRYNDTEWFSPRQPNYDNQVTASFNICQLE